MQTRKKKIKTSVEDKPPGMRFNYNGLISFEPSGFPASNNFMMPRSPESSRSRSRLSFWAIGVLTTEEQSYKCEGAIYHGVKCGELVLYSIVRWWKAIYQIFPQISETPFHRAGRTASPKTEWLQVAGSRGQGEVVRLYLSKGELFPCYLIPASCTAVSKPKDKSDNMLI